MLTGGCMCEGVRYEISEPLLGIGYCHCKRCQRRTGTGHSITGLTAIGSFTVTQGEDLLQVYEPPDDGWRKSFCRRCGSHVFTRDPENEDLIGVRIGTLDGDPGVAPILHQFASYAPAWDPVPDDGLQRFPERMGALPEA